MSKQIFSNEDTTQEKLAKLKDYGVNLETKTVSENDFVATLASLRPNQTTLMVQIEEKLSNHALSLVANLEEESPKSAEMLIRELFNPNSYLPDEKVIINFAMNKNLPAFEREFAQASTIVKEKVIRELSDTPQGAKLLEHFEKKPDSSVSLAIAEMEEQVENLSDIIKPKEDNEEIQTIKREYDEKMSELLQRSNDKKKEVGECKEKYENMVTNPDNDRKEIKNAKKRI